jgi:uncharacterized protein YcfL
MKKILPFVLGMLILAGCSSTYEGLTAEEWAAEAKEWESSHKYMQDSSIEAHAIISKKDQQIRESRGCVLKAHKEHLNDLSDGMSSVKAITIAGDKLLACTEL